MSTRYARIIHAQGSDRFLSVGGRRFTFEGRPRELSEVLSCDGATVSILPGYWRGQKQLGFSALDSAGYWRRRAMLSRDNTDAAIMKRKAREAIRRSEDLRDVFETQRYEFLMAAE